MIKTKNAGPTAKGGILGRRKRVLPEVDIYVNTWRQGPDGRFEYVRCRLSEARKSVEAATVAECGNDPLKSGRNAGILRAQKSPATSAKGNPRCRYCGARSAYPWGAPQICAKCEKIHNRHEPQATFQTIADKMRADPSLSWNQARDSAEGWVGDDQLYLRVQRTLANRERAAAAEQFQKHGPGRLEREGPAVKVSEAIAKAKDAARAKFRRQPLKELADAAE
jgi:hypothetical protein